MSTIAVNAVTDANGGNTATINSMTPTADSLQGFRNRIINGDMRIDQRNAGASVTPTNSQFLMDRWQATLTAASKFTVEQTVSGVAAPVGFTDYLAVTSSSAYSVLAGDIFAVRQRIEGFNVADLAWGTASAKAITISFWVRSSLTGTFGAGLTNSGFTRNYPFTYTISVADTWEYKTVTIAGDTSGTWLTTTGIGVGLNFGLGSGSDFNGTANAWNGTTNAQLPTGATSVVGTNGATFYITGVQLEVGSVATPFERRPYGTELSLCQRYCRTLDSASGTDKAMFSGVAYLNNTIIASYTFPTMRTSPTATITNATSIDVVVGGTVSQSNNTLVITDATSNSCQPAVNNSGTPFTQGHGAVVRFDGAGVVFSAEL